MSGISRLYELAQTRLGVGHEAEGIAEPMPQTSTLKQLPGVLAEAAEPQISILKQLPSVANDVWDTAKRKFSKRGILIGEPPPMPPVGAKELTPEQIQRIADGYREPDVENPAMSMKDAAQTLLMQKHSPAEAQIWKALFNKGRNNEIRSEAFQRFVTPSLKKYTEGSFPAGASQMLRKKIDKTKALLANPVKMPVQTKSF